MSELANSCIRYVSMPDLALDDVACEQLAKLLFQNIDPESVFAKLCKRKDAAVVFHAIGRNLPKDDYDALMLKVANFYAEAYRKNEIDGLGHLYPLIIEAQQIMAKKWKSKPTA